MDFNYYLKIFEQGAAKLDKKLLRKKQIEVETGIFGDSVFLKLSKKSWANPSPKGLTPESRIFFSVWINDRAIEEQKLLYNIHAFKLRLLKGYAIESRKFADSFRASFKPVMHQWPNVSLQFGPITLMEGWIKSDPENLKNNLLILSKQFLEIDQLIDDALAKFKKQIH